MDFKMTGVQDGVAFSDWETRSRSAISLPLGPRGAAPSPPSTRPLGQARVLSASRPGRALRLLPLLQQGCSRSCARGETPRGESAPWRAGLYPGALRRAWHAGSPGRRRLTVRTLGAEGSTVAGVNGERRE